MCSNILKKEAENCGAPYEKMGRQLVWHDEFDKGTIDYDKWCFKRTMGASDREYDNSEKYCRVEDGKAHLQVWRSEKEDANFALSEGFCTMDTMNFKYGYLEMRACVPFRHGAWPSFWMKSNTPFAKCAWMCETDIFEVFSSDRNAVCNLHKWGYGKHCMLPGGEGSISRAYTFKKYENLNNEYHVYGFEWDEKEMNFYVDGEKYSTFPIDPVKGNFYPEVIDGTTGFHDFQYIIYNNEIFSEGSGWKPEGTALTDEDEMPIDYFIDYVRLYQKEGEEIKLKDEIAAANAEKAAREANK